MYRNFFKVLIASLTKPLSLVTLGLGILLSALVPPASILLILLTLGAVGSMTLSDLTNPEYKKEILTEQKKPKLNEAIRLLEQVLRRPILKEVRIDVENTLRTLKKISELIRSREFSYVSFGFVEDSISELVTQLQNLLSQEQRARDFLNKTDINEIGREIEYLNQEKSTTSDRITKKEYEKAIALKRSQLKTIDTIKNKVKRIDSYILRIRSTLDSTFTDMTQINLEEDNGNMTNADVLSESLKQIIQDIEAYESQSIDIQEVISTQEKDTQPTETLVK